MRLNQLSPNSGARKPRTRVGRGIGSGLGKTAGRGHKGQKARAGGYHKVGFEGGQIPLQRRLPKFGFKSLKSLKYAEVRLHELNFIESKTIDMATLKAAGIVPQLAETIKIILSGELQRVVEVKADVRVTAGAKAAIEKLGGQVGRN